MSEFFTWATWDWDFWTYFWTLFLAAFFIGEALSKMWGSGFEMLTHHLRPIFHSSPLTWWLALGAWLWVGPHFLFPGLEDGLRKLVSS